ncbi:MAG: hypothetical protein ACT4P5_01240 [Armatimonadota bacterium]
MPREVFADEIEAFLERLDTVAAARVVANEGGEIERIYATSESARDDSTIRRSIASALMSQFNIHLDGWRIQVAHLEPTVEAEPIPECHLIRFEETITETTMRVVVDLRYEREGSQKTISGTAQAPVGQVHRQRTAALATVEALRPLVERSGSRPALEGLTLIPFAGATVALAAISLASEHATVLRIGAATVTGNEAEAVVAAVLDAVRKPVRMMVEPRRGRTDRHRQFEGLRRHYEQMIRTDAGPPPAAAPLEREQVRTSVEKEDPDPPQADVPLPVAAPAGAAAQDTIQTMTDIRPEREGGATTVMREETRGDGFPAAKAAPRFSVEDSFYRRLVTTGVPVHIRCRDGYEIPTAIIRDYGTYSLMVEANGVQELVFKHGIIAIRPYGPLPPETLTPS